MFQVPSNGHHDLSAPNTCQYSRFDQVSGKWKYAATVSWSEIGSVTRFHFVAPSPELFDGFEEAEKAGLEAANPG
jgi:hypothetical protein